MKIETTLNIGRIAAEEPRTIPYFEEKGIDYCCSGERSLREACEAAGVPLEGVLKELRKYQEPGREGAEDRWPSLAALLDHLEGTHHAFTRGQLELLRGLSGKVLAAHGERHPELKEIALILKVLDEELQQHLLKEEQVAFPYLRDLERSLREGAPREQPFPYYIFRSQPQRVLMRDHESAGEGLHQLRRLTGGYRPPPDACASFRAFYRALEELEKDLHLHIHLENNVLFPMAEELVMGLRKPG